MSIRVARRDSSGRGKGVVDGAEKWERWLRGMDRQGGRVEGWVFVDWR